MGKNATHFFIIIQPHLLEEASLVEIPPDFVSKYGKCLGRHVFLKPPKGAVHKVEVQRSNGRVWLHTGWQDFVECFSISRWYFLLFGYQGKSCFHVLVFDPSCSEIEYPGPVVDDDESEDYASAEILGERDNVPMANLLSRGRGDVTGARESTFERATAYQSPNPHFIVTMRPAYISNHYMHIPKCARTYFDGRDEKGLSLKGPDGRTRLMEYYYVMVGSHLQARIRSGWSEFVQEYDLQAGDACVFELINISRVLEFNISIFRV